MILAFVPYAFKVQKVLRAQVGPHGLRWTLIGLVAAAVVGVLVVQRRRGTRLGLVGTLRMLWVPALAALWMTKISVVAEAFHLLEYGLLGAVACRALSFSFRDGTAYVVAVVLTAFAGTLDELVQWLTPGRFWGLHDVGLNVAGGVLAQLWLALGLRVSWISGRPTRESLRAAVRPITILAGLGLLCLLVPPLAGAP